MECKETLCDSWMKDETRKHASLGPGGLGGVEVFCEGVEFGGLSLVG